MKNLLVNSVFFLSFFPFLRAIPGVSAEVQPVGSLLAVGLLLWWGLRRDRVSGLCALFVVILTFFAGWMYFRGGGPKEIVLQTVAYVLPLATLLFLRQELDRLSPRVFYVAVAIHAGIGILQHVDALQWAVPLFDRVVWRFNPSAVGGERGVALLTPEPAFGGNIIALMIGTSCYFYGAERISRWMFRGLLGLCVALLYINKSGTGFLLALLFIAGYYLRHFWMLPLRTKWISVVSAGGVVAVTVVVLGYLIEHHSGDFKILFIFSVLRDLIGDIGRLSEATVAAIAGKRFLTVWIGYHALFEHWGWGHGVAAHLLDFWDLSSAAGIYWVNNPQLSLSERFFDSMKPDAYGASVAMDTGLVGVLVLMALLMTIGRASRLPMGQAAAKENPWKMRAAILCPALFMILFYCTTALPVPWVMLAYVEKLGRIGRQ